MNEFKETIIETKEGLYRYRIKHTLYSSQRYGNCEMCGKFCESVYVQYENVWYDFTDEHPDIPDMRGWSSHKCSTWFGHEKCLLEARKKPIKKKAKKEINQQKLFGA